MRLELTCPSCGTAFYLEDATDVSVAICPKCDTPMTLKRGNLPPRTAPEQLAARAREEELARRLPPTAPLLRPIPVEPPSKGGQWMVWIAVGFGALWILVIAVALVIMLMRSRPPKVVVAPPPKPVAAPAPAPAPPPSIFTDTAPAPAPTPAPSVPQPTSKPKPQIVHGPPPLRLIPKAASLSDEEVGDAIRKGVDFLLANFEDNHIKDTVANEEVLRSGLNALAVYSLLASSQAVRDDRISPASAFMKKAIEKMKADPMRATASSNNAPVIYARALRASALAVYKRSSDLPALRDDVAYLRAAAMDGAYSYDDYFLRPIATPKGQPQKFREPSVKLGNRALGEQTWDNSNSQYGLLGVWAGADAMVESMDWYWKDVEQHWISCQLPDGRWNYRAGFPPSHNMTTAGIASLFVTHDQLDMIAGDKSSERHEYAPALAAGLKWYETGDNSVTLDANGIPGYGLYGVERVGLASGLKFFGKHDWYRELATRFMTQQLKSGAFVTDAGQDSIVNTAYLLLFLSRGRHPVLMIKLRYAGEWNYRPRDLANLTKFATASLERPMNSEVVDLKRKWIEWMDAPIVYLSGSQPPPMEDEDYENLRHYVENGGLLFTHADNGSKAFNDFAEQLATKISPYELRDISASDPIYTIRYAVQSPLPPLRIATSGTRILMIHSPTDISSGWVARKVENRERASQLGLNIHTYATGKAVLRNRIESTYLAEPTDPPTRTIGLARIRYGGAWDPEPAAWPRFARYLGWETGWKLDVQPIAADELDIEKYQIAHLTGITRDLPSETDITAIRRYVQEGGTLLVDICGGSTDFYNTFNDKWLPQIFPGVEAQPLANDDALLTGKIERMDKVGEDLTRPRLRPYAIEKIGNTGMRIRGFDFGKGRVIYSTIDLTTGLLGTNTWGILGFTPEWSQAFCKNVVLWAVKNREDHPTTQPVQ
ncbi:MAG TPA: DUF4159 domain-containing protein [Tepidisphaeraceae bacterium]|nr:DUF4159 domain-containing protein [Tepidisphaeraceae bacterium]